MKTEKSGQKAELFDIYDKNRIKTGGVRRRGEKLGSGEYRMAVHVCIFDSENRMLIQQRQPFKDDWNNMWDLTVGGSAVAGESSCEAAERELCEELGLKIDLSEARPSFTVNWPGGFDDYYLIKTDVDPSTLILQKEEVQDARWADKREVLQMQEEGTFIPYWFLDRLFDMEEFYCRYRDENTGIRFKYADEDNLASWMSMAEVVRENFPGLETAEKLETYRDTVRKNMGRETAICALFGNMVIGLLLFSPKHNMLSCLAVHPGFRRRGIATRLVEMMLERLEDAGTAGDFRGNPLSVETFREGDVRGVAARAFYRKMGFEEGELCVSCEGSPSQRFYLRRRAGTVAAER